MNPIDAVANQQAGRVTKPIPPGEIAFSKGSEWHPKP
jgi:hypothetical protein